MTEAATQGLARNVGLTLSRMVLTVVAGLGLSVVLARALGPAGNGVFGVAVLVPTLFASLLNLGMSPANAYFVGRGDTSPREALSASLLIAALTSLVGVLLGAAMIYWRGAAWFPGVPPPVLWSALAAFPPLLLSQVVASIHQGAQTFRRFNLVTLTGPLATLILTVVAVVGFRFGAAGALVAFAIGYGLAAALGIGVLVRDAREEDVRGCPAARPTRSVWRTARRSVGYGWKAHASNVLTLVNYRADIFLLNLFVAPATVGLYVVAVQVAERLWMLSQAAGTVALPRLAQLRDDELARQRLSGLMFRWILLATALGALIVAAIVRPALRIVFGIDFVDAAAPLLLLLPGIVLGSGGRVLANDLAARGAPQLNLYAAMAVVPTNVLLNLALIPGYGASGAAAATSLAYLLDFVLKTWMYLRRVGLPVGALLRPGAWDAELVRRLAVWRRSRTG